MNERDDVQVLLEQFAAGNRRALSRLVTLAARGRHLDDIRAALDTQPLAPNPQSSAPDPQPFSSPVIAVTGSGGVGKSTLIGRLIELMRSRGKSVAVVACDPQSPLTGGALLGDRVRMTYSPDDDGVFIRSLAVASGHQAVAEHLPLVTGLLRRFGFDYVIIETVGAGQGDTAARELADLLVVLIQPESGDDLQWEKAGLLEVADIVVLNKSDLPGADRTESQLREALNLPGTRGVPVVRTSSARNEGLAELWQQIERCLED